MVYVGTACTTALISTSFPPTDKVFSSHPCILVQTLSLRYLNTPFVVLSPTVGRPKYLSFKDSFCTLVIALTLSQTICWQPLLKNMEDFAKFTN